MAKAKLNWSRVAKEDRDFQAKKEGLPHATTDEERRKRPKTNKEILYDAALKGTDMRKYRARLKEMNFRKSKVTKAK
jgi:hypothetical protein